MAREHMLVRRFLLGVLPCALLLCLGVVALGFFLGLGAKAGQIAGEVFFPPPSEAAPSYVCYGSPALPRPLCKAVSAEQLQLILSESEIAE